MQFSKDRYNALLEKYGSSLNTAEIADFYCLSIHTIIDHRRKGTGPKYSKMGRSIRYDLDDAIEWRENNKVNPAGDE